MGRNEVGKCDDNDDELEATIASSDEIHQRDVIYLKCLASLVAENWRAGMTGITSSSKPSNARRYDILLMLIMPNKRSIFMFTSEERTSGRVGMLNLN